MKRLEVASNAVRKATENLVKAAQQALEQEEDNDNVDLNKSAVNTVVEVRNIILNVVYVLLLCYIIIFLKNRKLMREVKFYEWNANYNTQEVAWKNFINVGIKRTLKPNNPGNFILFLFFIFGLQFIFLNK